MTECWTILPAKGDPDALDESSWSVDGVVGGSAKQGTLAKQARYYAQYTAPAALAPKPNPVTVSARTVKNELASTTIRVVDGEYFVELGMQLGENAFVCAGASSAYASDSAEFSIGHLPGKKIAVAFDIENVETTYGPPKAPPFKVVMDKEPVLLHVAGATGSPMASPGDYQVKMQLEGNSGGCTLSAEGQSLPYPSYQANPTMDLLLQAKDFTDGVLIPASSGAQIVKVYQVGCRQRRRQSNFRSRWRWRRGSAGGCRGRCGGSSFRRAAAELRGRLPRAPPCLCGGLRVRREDRVLAAAFGEAHAIYSARVGGLVPRHCSKVRNGAVSLAVLRDEVPGWITERTRK